MKIHYIDSLIAEILDCVDRHNLGGPAKYCRRPLGDINEYGVADAANILYTLGEFDKVQKDRDEWIKVLQSMQDKDTGMYSESTHHTIHTTAHCTAALELFDAKPLYKCKYLEDCLTKEGMCDKLENGIRWATDPWRDSHIGAGIFVCLLNTGMIDSEWKRNYFEWCYENTDPETGFIFFGNEKKADLYQYMASGFHYFFNHESEHMPMHYPEKVIDSCLYLMENTSDFKCCETCGFIEIDVVYCLTRAMRQSPHRFYEAKAALDSFADKYLEMLYNTDYANERHFNDLHCLFGAVCCIAELQSALPGKIISKKPLRLVLDRRPFI